MPTNNFKQEPGSNKEIKDFCETNFGINFPMSEKTDVIGSNAHPFYKWAKSDYGIGAAPKMEFPQNNNCKKWKNCGYFCLFYKTKFKKIFRRYRKRN